MRPKGMIALLVIIMVFGTVFYLLSGKLIERGLEKAGESVVGAKVEIDNLKFNLAKLSISLDRLQVTNPNDTWKNLFETSRISFDMELAPLARKKIIINDITIAGIRVGTKRDTDGALPKTASDASPGWFEKASESLKQQVAEAPVLNLGILKQKVNVDSLFSLFNIQSPELMASARQDADLTFKKWRTELSGFNLKNDLARMETQINEIKSSDPKNLKQMIATLDKAKSAYNTLDKLKKDLDLKRKSALADLKKVTNILKEVDSWIENDFNAIKDKANLRDFTPNNIGKMLFGETIVLPALGFLKYIDLGRKYMPIAQQFLAAGKVESPPRMKGQDIRYPLENARPDFLMEHILISAATNQQDTSQVMSVSGEVNGITSQPRLYGNPLTFVLQASLPKSRAYAITGRFDHTNDVAEDRIEVKASGVRFGKIDLPVRPYLPVKVDMNRGNLSADLNLVGDDFAFNINLTASSVKFLFANEAGNIDVISKATRSVFDSIDKLQISAGISGRIDNPKLNIRSNVDEILARRVQALIGESVRAARTEIRNRVTSMTESKKQALSAFINKNRQEITGQLDQIQKDVDEKLAVIEEKRKKIEKKIEKEKKKGINKLKDIFKRND